MLTEIYIEALLVDEELADQVWQEWAELYITENLAMFAWFLIRRSQVDLNQVTLPCNDYDRTVKFYRQLGFRLIVDSLPSYARFETERGTTFSIHASESQPVNSEFVVYFEVDDVDTVVNQLKGKGLKFDSEPIDQEWLWREAYIRDPYGNTLCIYNAGQNRQYPSWRVPDGSA